MWRGKQRRVTFLQMDFYSWKSSNLTIKLRNRPVRPFAYNNGINQI